MGDEVYQPQGEEVSDDAGPLESKDTLNNRGVEPLDEGYSPPERPLAVDEWGTTAAEQRRGETLERRLAREVPEQTDLEGDEIGDMIGAEGEPMEEEVGGPRAGRLVAPDEGAHSDTDAQLFARDVGIDSGAATAEEAAVHVVRGPESPEEGAP
jgi:nitroreductase